MLYKVCGLIVKGFMNVVFSPVYLMSFFKKSELCPPISSNILYLTAATLAKRIRRREISCESVMKAYISRAREINPIINAIIEDRFADALKDAENVDNFLSNTELNEEELKKKYPLLGVPLTIKGSIAVAGLDHNAGVVGRNVKAVSDGVIVKYAREAGAIPILISNVPELCLNWETTNKLIGTTRNPYDTTRTVGGSSGGEASLLGAAASVVGLGSDIAGSLRLPAHFCGIWGHKPSPGAVSHVGHYPHCKNEKDWMEVFTLGPLARFATDLRLLLKVIVEPEKKNILKLEEEVAMDKIKVFYIEEFKSSFMNSINKNVFNAIEQVVSYCNSVCNQNCVKVEIPLMKYATALSYFRLLDVDDIENLFEGKGEGAYAELLRFLTFRSKCEFTSILYGVMRRNRKFMPNKRMEKIYSKLDELRQQFIEILGDDGVLICPVYPNEAHPHGDVLRKLFDAGYLSIFNALGFPATSCPVSFTDKGLPVGIQVVAAPNHDRLTLSVAEKFEQHFGGWKPPNCNITHL